MWTITILRERLKDTMNSKFLKIPSRVVKKIRSRVVKIELTVVCHSLLTWLWQWLFIDWMICLWFSQISLDQRDGWIGWSTGIYFQEPLYHQENEVCTSSTWHQDNLLWDLSSLLWLLHWGVVRPDHQETWQTLPKLVEIVIWRGHQYWDWYTSIITPRRLYHN